MCFGIMGRAPSAPCYRGRSQAPSTGSYAPLARLLLRRVLQSLAAYLCFIALVFVLLNLIVDLLYFAVDPRLRVERGGAY
jgi:hypothetical protein